MPSRPTLRRAGLMLAVPALTLSGLTIAAAPATAAPDPAPGADAATWLTGQLSPDNLMVGAFGPDYGLSIDTALGLDAVGGHTDTVQDISTAVSDDLEAYITGEAFGDTGSTYAGPAGKALVMAQTAGDDPTTYGGIDLVERVESVVATDAPITGRIVDVSQFGDFANVLGQSYAAQGLFAEASPRAADARDFLLKQQCSEGYFRLNFKKNKQGNDQTCDGGKANGNSDPDTDATAVAVLALLDQSATPAVGDAIDDAVAWLLDEQRANGSFGGGPTTEAPNTNSTGLAGWVLNAVGETAAAEKAGSWVRRHQAVNVGPCAPFADADLGAIAYDQVAHTAAQSGGITDDTADQWRRATAQALPALQWTPAATGDAQVVGFIGFAEAGETFRAGVFDAAPGSPLCARLGTQRVLGAAGTGGEADLKVKLPGGTAQRTIRLFGEDGEIGTVEFTALDDLKVPFTLKSRVAKGNEQVVRVSGLERGENVRIKFRGEKVASGGANANGNFSARFKVTGKAGEAPVQVIGHFPNRTATKTFMVAR